MNKLKLYTLSLVAAAGLATASCTDDFKNLNLNPNLSPVATPETLLAPAIHDLVTRNQTRALRLTNELMQVHVTTINSDEIHRYVVRPSESDYMWNNWYLQRTNILDMYQSAEAAVPKDRNFMGIALVLDAWVMSLLTDTYGDVPYTEANQGKDRLLMPKFDAQKDIYTDILRKLEEANAHFKSTAPAVATDPHLLPADQMTLDPLYGGNLAKWRKFGNSLYLRLLMRVSGKADMNAPAKISEIVSKPNEYPIFAANEESAILWFTTTQPMVSAFNTYRDYDFNGDNGLSEFFVDNLNAWDDPRLGKWASKSDGGFVGIPSGYKIGQVPPRKSYYLAALKDEPRLGNIINYAELQFILAEAALKGYIAGDPKTYYEKGVESAITMWGLALPANHLANPALAWDVNENEFLKMEKIMLQKYYTLFFTDFQQWFEYRRTGLPRLPKGEGLQNGGQMPSRLKYPVIVQSLNGANYNDAVAAMGADDLNTKVWWNQN
ncbi:MAG: SusD/RagB family nutrient-binding outer membrane lipoprotein [Adhaeribacter sp.]